MGRTFVKICGITRAEDAHAAVRAGADAVGFIFAPSPRRVQPKAAGAISGELHPSVRRIGVFVNATLPTVISTIDEAGLDGAQLQGTESSGFVAELRAAHPALMIFKVFKSAAGLGDVESFAIDAAFIDPKDTDDVMGPVNPVPFDTLRTLSLKFVVAGGLDPSNVGALVSAVRPWGVDVSGGVESAPGIKDPTKIRSFIKAVREADTLV